MAGRSRGRTRIRVETKEPIPIAPEKPEATLPVAPVPATTKVAPEGGRGRGLTKQPTSTTQTTTPTTTTATKSSSEDSPPNNSPPQSTTGSSVASSQPMGRAALRGLPHQPGTKIRTELLPQMERLQLQDTGDIAKQEQKREVRIESVLYTKPESCTDKTGKTGLPVKIVCNYFEVINQPNWILYQYHVDFAPLVDSRSLRIGLMNNHNALFPQNKAFDGSTLYSLTKLPDEITEVASKKNLMIQLLRLKSNVLAKLFQHRHNSFIFLI